MEIKKGGSPMVYQCSKVLNLKQPQITQPSMDAGSYLKQPLFPAAL